MSNVQNPPPVVALCGSRSLAQFVGSAIPRVVGSLVSSGRSLSVGCAAGADAAVVSAAVMAGAADSVRVHAVGGSCGAGFAGHASELSGVQAARAAGASVVWWSGGPASVPLRSRLVARSLACVSSAAATVAFVSGPPPRAWSGSGLWRSCGSGTWSAVAASAIRGSSVVVFAPGAAALPSLPVGGSWVPAGSGVWSGGWKFVPSSLF